MTPTLYLRDGTDPAALLEARIDPEAREVRYTETYCSRCGGTGVYTWWTTLGKAGGACFKCGGQPRRRVSAKLYTAGRIAALDAARDRRHAKATAAREAKIAAAKAEVETAKAATLDRHPGLGDALAALAGSQFGDSLSEQLDARGTLSEAQVAAAIKSAAKRAEEAAEVIGDAPRGRETVTGTIVSAKWRDTDFGVTAKILVKIDDSNAKVYGTLPRAVERAFLGEGWIYDAETDEDRFDSGTCPVPEADRDEDTIATLRGHRLTFTATFEAGIDGDATFAIFKRPAKAALL